MAHKPLYLNTRTLSSHLFFGPYIFFPLLAGLTWLGGILALLALWVMAGKPRYQSDEASVVFISDVGADHHKLFIGICVTTAGLYIMGLLAERWLRHVDRLPTDLRPREKWFDWLAIFFGTVGALGLVFLSIFDAFNYSTVHWSMTVVFIIGVALSAIFQSAEIWSLHKDHPDRKSLLRNSILKMIVVAVAIALAVGFAVTYGYCDGNSYAIKGHSASKCNTVTSAAAALEWAVAFWLFFYFLTLAADLWPAGKSSPRYMRRLAKWQERHGEGDDFTGRRAFAEYPERWQGQEQPAADGSGMREKEGGWKYRAQQMRQAMWERNVGIEKQKRDGTYTPTDSTLARDSTSSGAPMIRPPPTAQQA